MAPTPHGDRLVAGDEQELVDLVELLDRVTHAVAALDDEAWSGDSPNAQENRAIGGARAQLARRRAVGMRGDLDEARRRASELATRSRAIREARRHARAGSPSPMPIDPGHALLREAAADLVDVHDRDEVAERVVAGALKAVPGARWSSLSVLDTKGLAALHRTSGSAAAALDQRQRQLGVGPVPEVLATGEGLVVDDVAAEARWSALAPSARDLGITGVVVVALPGRRVRACLALYTDVPRGVDAAALRAAGVFADHAAIALSGARRVAGLHRALESRDVLGQAKGMLVQRDGVSPQAAFEKLVEASQHANLKVADVARWMVEGTDASPPAAS